MKDLLKSMNVVDEKCRSTKIFACSWEKKINFFLNV